MGDLQHFYSFGNRFAKTVISRYADNNCGMSFGALSVNQRRHGRTRQLELVLLLEMVV